MLPGVIGVIQANEALKLLVGYGEPLVGRLLTFDAHDTRFGEFKVKRDPKCPTCGNGVVVEQEKVSTGIAVSPGGEVCS